MQKNKNSKGIYFLCAALAFAGATCGIAYHNLRTAGSLYLQSDDGDLYLSIARNMLQNAHFIQTARPIEAFVVPPGLPAMCTLLLFLFGGLSRFLVGAGFCAHLIGGASADMLGLLGFQYIVYGMAAALMAMTALKLAFHGLGVSLRPAQGPSGQAQRPMGQTQGPSGPKSVAEPARAISKDDPSTGSGSARTAFPWILSAAIGVLVPAFYVWCSIKIRHPNPGFVLTENYVVFLIALILWMVVRGADLRAVTGTAFVLTLFRPACGALLLTALGWMLIRAIRNAVAKKHGRAEETSGKARLLSKEAAPHRVAFYDIFVMLAVFALVIGINIGVNYLETGEVIPLEDYGNLDVYLANNEKAGPDWYHSGKVPEFASVRYNQIVLNETLTRYRQNELAGEALREYVKANTETVLRNACTRFVRLFCETWGAVFYAFLVCFAAQMILKGLRWPQKVYIALMAVLLAVPPAFGLLVARYSAPMLPLFIVMTAGTAGQIACIAATREKKASVPAPVPGPLPVPEAAITAPEPVEGTTLATPPDASTRSVSGAAAEMALATPPDASTRSAPKSAAEIPEEATEEAVLEAPDVIPEEIIEETVEEPIEGVAEETVEGLIGGSSEETVEEIGLESVEIEEPEADLPLIEAVKTLSAHELAAKLFPKTLIPKAPEEPAPTDPQINAPSESASYPDPENPDAG